MQSGGLPNRNAVGRGLLNDGQIVCCLVVSWESMLNMVCSD